MEVAQAVDDTPPCVTAIGVGQRAGRSLDGVEQVGDPGMVGLQAVHDRPDRRVGLAQRGEQQRVLGAVVSVHVAAVPQAVHLQLPQRAAGLELSQGILDRLA